MRRLGFTLTEALVSLGVIAIVAAIMTPVVISARKSARIGASQLHLKQLWTAVQLYRNDYDGVDVFNDARDYYRLGLPTPDAHGQEPLVGVLDDYGATRELWQSPCGDDQVIFETGPTFVRGRISYVPYFYAPTSLSSAGNAADYGDYIRTYKENIVIFVDPYCNPTGTSMRAIRKEKRGIAILHSGEITNRVGQGNAFFLQWYSNPP